MYKAWNPLGTPLLAYLPAHQNASWCWHLLLSALEARASIIAFPLRLGWPEKNSFDDGTSRDKDRTRVAPHENLRNNNIQIGNLMPCSHRWVRGFHVLTGGRYLIWCQLRRRHLWLYTTTPIPTLSAMPTIAGEFSLLGHFVLLFAFIYKLTF